VVPEGISDREAAACPTRSGNTAYAAGRLLRITPSHIFAVPGSQVAEPYATFEL
jgi:hypothetical protein